MNLFVGCSSRDNIPSKYYEDCKELLDKLFASQYDLVFGACGHGLMGLAYNSALNNYSDVIGIYPDVYKSEAEELQCLGIPVKTVLERTNKLIELSHVLLFLPGGLGTLCELFMAVESKRACEHDKPIIIYNSCGYFDKMLEQLDLMYSEGFVSEKDKECYYVCDNVADVLSYLNNYYNDRGVSRKREC